MTIETGSSEEVRSGFVVAHTNAPQEDGAQIKGTFHVLYEAPDADLADYWIGSGILRFFEQITNGTIRQVVIYAKAMLDYNNRES